MKLVVDGQQGPFTGVVEVSGAKNSATRVLAAALLADGEVSLRNVPLHLEDFKAKLAFIGRMGAETAAGPAASALTIRPGDASFDAIDDYDLPIRTTYLLAAAALARHGRANVPYPGGCKIGSRGYDLHMMVWRDLGCEVEETEPFIRVTGRLRGGEIDFPISTVGGTENALMCAAVADGETVIRNAYITPEVHDLIAFLREMGARIEVEGGSIVRVAGAGRLLRGASFAIMADRIEALTWMVLAAVTGATLEIRNVPFADMQVPLIHLREAGIDFFANSGSALVSPATIGSFGIQPFELACGTHPGVISDMQSFYVFLGLFAAGRSVIYDYRYPTRIAYAAELAKFAPGAIEAEHGVIRTFGPARLTATEAGSTDLRGSMAAIMAALCAEGTSTVHGVEMALRGYNDLPGKLAALGIAAEWSAT